jgi:hypothetical protein
MKNGDFSALLAPSLNPKNLATHPYQIFNPFSRVKSGSGFKEDPFRCDSAGNPLPLDSKNRQSQTIGANCNKIPTSLINPVSQALLQYFPNPTTPGVAAADGTNNFQQPGLQERASYYTSTIRVDHNISEKNRIFGRASWYDRNSTYNNYFQNLATGTFFQFLSRQGALDEVYTFNPTTVLNVRYGYNRFIRVDGNNPASHGFDLTSVGFPASYNNLIPDDRRAFPRLDITSYQGTGFNNEPRPIDTHSVVATLNKTLGSHAVKVGAEYRIYRENDINIVNDVTGRFMFDATYTRGPNDNSDVAPNSIGQSFASFLMGIPSGSSYVRRPADYAEESDTWGFFIQDDWRFNSRLTLNLGLRYEFETPLQERYNRSVRGFDPNFVQPIEAQAQQIYANDPKARTPEVSQLLVRGGLTFPGVNGQPEGLYDTPKHNFMPRIGLAFKLNEKTVVRAGYGIFFGFLGQRRGDVVQSGFSQDTNVVPTVGGDGVTFIFPNGQTVFSNPFPNGITEPVGAGNGPQTFLGQSITFFNPNPQTPYNQRWELGFQRELPGGWVAEASYVGNRGTHIEISRDLNVTPQKYLSKLTVRDDATKNYLTAKLDNPFLNLIPNIGASTTISREQLLRPFPQFGSVTATNNQGYSWYHSLQTRIEKRFSKGYTFQASYTFSKFMQATELLNQDDPLPTEVISDSDYPHRFSANGIYELPFGKGREFLTSTNGIVSRFVGGWQFQGLYTFQSGAPIQFGNVFYNGDVRDIRLPGDQQTPEHWFNTAGFVTTTAQQPDHNMRFFPMRFGFVRYPRQNNFDLSLVKNTAVTERMNVQFRAEFINAFNRVWLSNPNGTNNLNTSVTAATFGQINGSLGANYARRVQLGLKLVF